MADFVKCCGIVAGVCLVLTAGCGGGGSASNDAPRLITTAIQLDEDTSVSQTLNATSKDGGPVSFAIAAQPQHGSLTLTSGGTATYVPTADFNGSDSFQVRLSDTTGHQGTASVSVTVNPLNDAPTASDDEVRLGSGTMSVPVLANDTDVDGDTLTVSILSQPRGGTVSVSNSNVVTFVPENAFAGPTSFTYRISDAQGLTAEASAKLVVEPFQGVVFLADESTPGLAEVHFFDGFRTTRVSAPLSADATISNFTLAGDGRHLAYIVTTPARDLVFIADVSQADSAREIYATPSASVFMGTSVTLNHDASVAVVSDFTFPSPLKLIWVNTATTAQTIIGAMNPEIVQAGNSVAFNPVTGELYIQAEVGGSPPPLSGSGFLTLYSAPANNVSSLQQIGATYAADSGGSGNQITPTPDGKYVLHWSATYPPLSGDVLLNDRVANTETFLFRDFATYEFPTPFTFDLSADGVRACFILELVNPNPTGQKQIWVAETASPGTAIAVTSQAPDVFECQWASDNRTVVYYGTQNELWQVDTTQPGASTRLREPLAAGEIVEYVAVAEKRMAAVIGVRPAGSVIPELYRVSLSAPGTSTKFFDGYFPVAYPRPTLDAHGATMLYKAGDSPSGPANPSRLHLLSTQILNYDFQLSRPDGSVGVLQFGFLPAQ